MEQRIPLCLEHVTWSNIRFKSNGLTSLGCSESTGLTERPSGLGRPRFDGGAARGREGGPLETRLGSPGYLESDGW